MCARKTARTLDELKREMRSVARGAIKAPEVKPAPTLGPLFSPGNLTILEVIAKHQPASVSELAERLGRAQPNVTRSLQQLMRHGLVALEREEGKRELRPMLVARYLTVDLHTGTCKVGRP